MNYFSKVFTKDNPLQGKPLQLVGYNTEKGTFELGQEALQALRQVQGPIGVIAVCGKARQGKSFILNQLLGSCSGFKVAPTHKPCTKGLWLWSAPIEQTSVDGSKYSLVLLDSEGIEAWDQTNQYSSQIFSLAILLSSLFVYNSMGPIDEAALDKLHLITELTKHIRVRAHQGSEENLSDFTPSFLWLLRDFYLLLEEDDQKITPKDYLERALMEGSSKSIDTQNKNKIRQSIKTLFPDRDCFTLVRPVNDESQLIKLEDMPVNKLRPEFIQGVKQLNQQIFSKTKPKAIGSSILNGVLFAGLTETYVKAINQGAVPTIATAWQGVVELECTRAVDVSINFYKKNFNQQVDTNEEKLLKEHQICIDGAMKEFNKIAVGDRDKKLLFEKKVLSNVNEWFDNFKKRRYAESDQKISEAINNVMQQLYKVSNRENSRVDDVIKVFNEFYLNFNNDASLSGPNKLIKLVEFYTTTFVQICQQVSMKIEARFKQQLQSSLEEQNRLKNLYDKGLLKQESIEKEYKSLQQFFQKKQIEDQSKYTNLQDEYKQKHKEYENFLQEISQLKKEITRQDQWLSQEKLKVQEKDKVLDQISQESSKLQKEVHFKDQQLNQLKHNFEQSLSQQVSKLNATQHSGQREIEALQSNFALQIDEYKQQVESKLQQISTMHSELQNHNQQIKEQNTHIQNMNQELLSYQTKFQEAQQQMQADQDSIQKISDELRGRIQEIDIVRTQNQQFQSQISSFQQQEQLYIHSQQELKALQQQVALRDGQQEQYLQYKEQEAKEQYEKALLTMQQGHQDQNGQAVGSIDNSLKKRKVNGVDQENQGQGNQIVQGQQQQDIQNMDPSQMSISQIRTWLSENGHTDDIWNIEKTKPKKKDWIELIRKHI